MIKFVFVQSPSGAALAIKLDNLSLFLKLYYTIIDNCIKSNEVVNLVKNSNELANLKTAVKIKKNELFFIEQKIKQYQAQMIVNSYNGY